MAARKKSAPQGTGSLFATVLPPPPEASPEPIALEPELELELTPVVEERKLRIVPPPAETPDSEVIIEPMSDGRFVVSLLRDHGTTVAAVVYTRALLEQLLRRIPAALEVG